MFLTGVLHMYYWCMKNMCNTTNNTVYVLRANGTCNPHVAHLVVYIRINEPNKQIQ